MLSIDEKDNILRSIQSHKSDIALPMEELEAIDARLAADWGIGFLDGFRDHDALVKSLPDGAPARAYVAAHQAVADALMAGDAAAERSAEARLYDVLAHDDVLGTISSQRRHYILDAICAAIGVFRALGLSGNLLDIGCHAGFITAELARRLQVSAVGIDPSGPAIELAISRTSGEFAVQFQQVGMPWATDQRFDLAISIDSMPASQAGLMPFLKSLANLLAPGGVALIASVYWVGANVDLTRRQLRACGLGFGFADILGGYGQVPLMFEATGFVVLLKGGARQYPRKISELMESDWDMFREYANTAGIEPSRKIQAYERAHRAAA